MKTPSAKTLKPTSRVVYDRHTKLWKTSPTGGCRSQDEADEIARKLNKTYPRPRTPSSRKKKPGLIYTIDSAGSRYIHEDGVVPHGDVLLSNKVRPKDLVSGYEFLYMGRWIDICDVDLLDFPQVTATVRNGKPEHRVLPSWKPTEVDFGCWWSENGISHGPYWRVSWNAERHELYATRRMNGREERIVLGQFAEKKDAEAAMEGWADTDSPIYENLTALKQRLGVGL